ncbi:MAG TPA: metallophosphoesterase, partial [Halothiobacillaceae bacterium]|nr:metallophosphoesterase [Halothiobacillaceae bacterium]
RHPEARAIVYGHTHRRVIDQSQIPWVLNPGAAGRIRAIVGPGCLLLNAQADVWSVETFVCPRAHRRS